MRLAITLILLAAMPLCLLSQSRNVGIGDWKAETVLTEQEAEAAISSVAFRAYELPDEVVRRMRGASMPAEDCPITPAMLRYLPLLHRTADGTIKTGEMVVAKEIAGDVAAIFLRLYREGYPIERIRLIDDYGASDEKSMEANNTSAFCYRQVSGTRRLSKHSRGLAIDINPLYNPCFHYSRGKNGQPTRRITRVQPASATPYTDRTKAFGYKIEAADLAVKLFKEKGFRWGGDWRSMKDYQHFEK